MKFHHVGCLVSNLKKAKISYKLVGLDSSSTTVHVSSQDVNICLLKMNNHSFIELIEPLDKESNLYSLLYKGATFYHIAFASREYDKLKKELQDNNNCIMTEFKSELFNNKRCLFFRNSIGHLIEIIEV